jgi:hypothetical protein
MGRTTASVGQCDELRGYIIGEEEAGRLEWSNYRDLADQLNSLSPNSAERAPLVESIAISVIGILGHDLAIYKEMQRFPDCVKANRLKNLTGIIGETESAINFLNGSEAINGTFFDPSLGNWNTEYYAEYVSALDYLKGQSPTT